MYLWKLFLSHWTFIISLSSTPPHPRKTSVVFLGSLPPFPTSMHFHVTFEFSQKFVFSQISLLPWSFLLSPKMNKSSFFCPSGSLPQDFIYKISSTSSLNKPKLARSGQSFCSATHFLSFPWNYDLHYPIAGTTRTTINFGNHFFCTSAEQIHWAPPLSGLSSIWTEEVCTSYTSEC